VGAHAHRRGRRRRDARHGVRRGRQGLLPRLARPRPRYAGEGRDDDRSAREAMLQRA
jgi:hypothetical protein